MKYKKLLTLEVHDSFLISAYNYEHMKSRLEYSVIYVAEVERQIVGFANYSPARDGGKVEQVAIYLYPNF